MSVRENTRVSRLLAALTGCRKMHLERNATWGFAFGDRCFGPFCDGQLTGVILVLPVVVSLRK